MEALTASDVLNATGGRIVCGQADAVITSVAIDSREVKPGGLFFAIRGKRTDGHNYVKNALRAGATVAVIDRDIDLDGITEGTVIKVSHAVTALSGLAASYRSRFQIPIVAVTGSVGKTTTKEMCHCILSAKYNTLKNEKNYNSDIGMPLTVMNLNKSHEAAVLEMGMSGQGEISLMSIIAKPHVAIITNIGVSHIERLGSKENILKAKMEIEDGLVTDGCLLVNGDDPMLTPIKEKSFHNTYLYGIDNPNNDFYAANIASDGQSTTMDIVTPYGSFPAKINTVGKHNVYNAVAASTAGLLMGLNFHECAEGLLFFENIDMRQNIFRKNGYVIIEDAYNASPDSMAAALDVLKMTPGNRKIAVLSDMLELGEYAADMHRQVGEKAAQMCDFIICYGENAKYYVEAAGSENKQYMHFADAIECADALKKIALPGDVILFKGSRGMKTEKCMNKFLGSEN